MKPLTITFDAIVTEVRPAKRLKTKFKREIIVTRPIERDGEKEIELMVQAYEDGDMGYLDTYDRAQVTITAYVNGRKYESAGETKHAIDFTLKNIQPKQ